jgi:dephospho-CoA kinase
MRLICAAAHLQPNNMRIFFLIGSSGSGKTTAARGVEKMQLPNLAVRYSDSLPVPSVEEMVREYGSQEEWQRANTVLWVGKIKAEVPEESDVILDMQTRPLFIKEACTMNSISTYQVILFDCSDEERKKRLVERGQPELATFDMMNWAKYLKERSLEKGYPIIDNTFLAPAESLGKLMELIGRVIK